MHLRQGKVAVGKTQLFPELLLDVLYEFMRVRAVRTLEVSVLNQCHWCVSRPLHVIMRPDRCSQFAHRLVLSSVQTICLVRRGFLPHQDSPRWANNSSRRSSLLHLRRTARAPRCLPSRDTLRTFSRLPPSLKISQQRKMDVVVARECSVAPGPINRNPQNGRLMILEFWKDLVVERNLVAANRTPVCRVEDEDHRAAAQLAKRERLVRSDVQCEIGSGSSRREYGH